MYVYRPQLLTVPFGRITSIRSQLWLFKSWIFSLKITASRSRLKGMSKQLLQNLFTEACDTLLVYSCSISKGHEISLVWNSLRIVRFSWHVFPLCLQYPFIFFMFYGCLLSLCVFADNFSLVVQVSQFTSGGMPHNSSNLDAFSNSLERPQPFLFITVSNDGFYRYVNRCNWVTVKTWTEM